MEEFLERQVGDKAIVRREGVSRLYFLLVRIPLLLLASLGLTVRRRLEGPEIKQERHWRRRQINWLCWASR